VLPEQQKAAEQKRAKPARVAGVDVRACLASQSTVLTLQIGTAVAVVAITALQLANVENWKDLYQAKLCKASGDPTNTSVCTYIYAVGAVSIVLTIIIGLLQVRQQQRMGGSEREGDSGWAQLLARANATTRQGACMRSRSCLPHHSTPGLWDCCMQGGSVCLAGHASRQCSMLPGWQDVNTPAFTASNLCVVLPCPVSFVFLPCPAAGHLQHVRLRQVHGRSVHRAGSSVVAGSRLHPSSTGAQ
jgi:hypothetical protein